MKPDAKSGRAAMALEKMIPIKLQAKFGNRAAAAKPAQTQTAATTALPPD